MEMTLFGEASEEMYRYADRHFWKNSTQRLSSEYDKLSDDFDDLNSAYDILSGEYDVLSTEYDVLSNEYDTLSAEYEELKNRPQIEGDYGTLSIEIYVDAYYTDTYFHYTSIVLPSLTSYNGYTLSYNPILSAVEMPNATSIMYGAFDSCTGMKILKVTSMSKSDVLNNIHGWFYDYNYPTDLSVWTADNPETPFVMEF